MVQPTYEYSGVCYTATSGQTIFALTSTDGNPIGYLSPDHIHVRTSANSGETWVPLPVNTAWDFADPATSIVLVTPATAGVWVDIQRKTPIDEDWVDFQAGSLLTAGQLNDAETFSLYCDQEIADSVSGLTPSIIGLDTTDDLPEGQINLYYTDTRVAAWIAANLSDTDDLKEGVLNLYYTDARVNAWINTNLSSTDQLAEGSNNLYYTDARAEAVVAAWIAGNLSSTDDLPEGSINLYYTNARVASWINNNLGSTDQLVEGSNNLYYTDARVEAYVNGEGYVKGPVVTKIVAGNNVGISPESGTGIVTINATGGSGQGIPEAPLDGTAYGRQDGHWEPVLMLTGGDLTGDLTLDTDKVVLGVNGNIAAAGLGQFGTIGTATGTCGVSVGQTGNTFGSLALYSNTTSQSAIEVFSAPDGSTTKTSVAAINNDGSITAAGDVKIGGTLPSSPNISLNANGSGDFGNLVIGANKSLGLTRGVYIRYPADSANPGRTAFEITANAAGVETGVCSIKGDGSAIFKGDVAIGDSTTTFLDKVAIIAALTEEQRTTFAAAITAWNNRPEPYDAEDPETLPADLPLREAIVRVTTAGKINLNANGSASFAGGEVNIDSSGRLLVGTTTEGVANADNLTIEDSGHAGITIRSGTSSKGAVFFSDATSGSGEFEGVIEYNHSDNNMLFFTSGSERLRIDSAGDITATGSIATKDFTLQDDNFGCYRLSKTSTQAVLELKHGNGATAGSDVIGCYSGDQKVAKIGNDGSATFAGDVDLGAYNPTSTTTAGCLFEHTGGIYTQVPASAPTNKRVFGARYGTTYTNQMYADGSATFASRITAAGYSMANLTQL